QAGGRRRRGLQVLMKQHPRMQVLQDERIATRRVELHGDFWHLGMVAAIMRGKPWRNVELDAWRSGGKRHFGPMRMRLGDQPCQRSPFADFDSHCSILPIRDLPGATDRYPLRPDSSL